MDQLRLRKAVDRDRECVLAILDEAASWLGTIGVAQWPSPFSRTTVERDFEQNEVWLAATGERVVGTISVLKKDRMFWGDLDGDAWYLHRLAIRRNVAGCGRSVLALIEGEARHRGVEYLRLGCGAGLQCYYAEAGYSLRSTVTLVSGASSPPRSLWFCYEKWLGASP